MQLVLPGNEVGMPKKGSDTAASPVKETLLWTARSHRKATISEPSYPQSNK